MYRAAAGGVTLADRLRPAHTHWTRLRGLLGTRQLAPGEGLWLKPSNQVHMLGMRYAVDLLFLDADGRVLRLVHALAPNRLSPRVAGATSVLELPAGTLTRAGVGEGVRLEIAGEPDAGPRSRADRVGALLCNLALALLYGFFAAAHVTQAVTTGQWATTLPLVAQEALLVVLFLTRRRSRDTSGRPADWVVGIGGTVLPLCMRPAPGLGPLSALGEPLQAVGLAAAVVALGCLGRSIGVVAANRGIQTAGLYRLVRHPMYGGYLLGYLGYALSYPTPRNLLLSAATLLALMARATVEERFLARDPRYRAYLHRTRWRFVPFIY